jgi:hypothetical protein
MHGLDVTYPSEGNSLRAILLLEYASELADWLDWESSKS